MKRERLVVWFLPLVLAACGSEPGTGAPACEPGAVLSCACAEGEGTATCDERGRPGACVCFGAVEWSPAVLQFGEVETPVAREATLALRREGGAPTPIRSVRLADADPGFSVVSAPDAIPAGGAMALVVVSFRADLPVEARGTLIVEAEGVAPIAVPLHASRVGLALSCSPATLDFGTQTLGVAAKLPVTCTNVGAVSGTGSALLRLQDVTSDDPEFSGTLPPERLFGPGESFTVEVHYLPADAEPDRAIVRLVTEEGLELAREASGSSGLATCRLQAPDHVTLAGVPGEVLAGAVEFRNAREDAGCLVDRVEVEPGCAEGFEFDLPPAGTVILPGAVLAVPVRFQGEAQDAYACALRAFADDPEGHEYTAAITAELSWRPCLDLEGPTELAATSPSCDPSTVEPVLVNRCNGDFLVDELRLPAEWCRETGFSVAADVPATIPPGGRLALPITFDPAPDDGCGPGGHYSHLEVHSRLDPAPWIFTFTAERRDDDVRSRLSYQVSGGPLDVLAVIDNGTDMAAESTRVVQELGALPERLFGYEYRLAVTTTGVAPAAGGACPGAAGGGENGRFVPADGARPRAISPWTPDARAAWEANLQVGACHDAPAQPLAAAVRGLDYLEGRYDDPFTFLENDGNAGLLRDHAALLLLFVGDRDDASPGTVEDLWDDLRWTRPFGAIDLVTVSGGADAGCTGPSGEAATAAPRLHALAALGGGSTESICDGPWSFLDRYDQSWAMRECFDTGGEPADWNRDGTIDALDLVVRVAGEDVPPVGDDGRVLWTWSRGVGMVCFPADALPPPGVAVSVRRLVCDQ